jgi:pimeloyl-ACP methyl ester carboxylesterase
MRIVRLIGITGLGILAAGSVAFIAALLVYRDIPPAELEAKYMSSASKFINIDGVRIHYRDEGPPDGPAIVLIHANFGSLLQWDPWVDALKDRYRVVRFDMTAHGLTGPDPSGDYSMARTVTLTERLVDALALRHFAIAGTSLGGSVAMQYTALHPDRIDKLILVNAGALEGQVMRKAGMRVPRAANILKYITPRALARYMLLSRAGDPSHISEKQIDEWYDMWMLKGQRTAILERLRSYSGLDVVGVTAKIAAPTLIEWGAANRQTPPEQAYQLRDMLKSAASVALIMYPGIGHFALQEAGPQTAHDARAYLDGKLANSPGGAAAG